MCNIKLRNFKIKDINNVYIRALNNKKLMQFSENRFRLFNKKNCLEFFKSMKKNKNFFFLVSKQNKHDNLEIPVGTLTGYVDYNNKICDLGILIWENQKGYGQIAWQIAIDKIFEKNYVRKITAGTMANNKAMIKLFKKSSMKFELKKKKTFIYKNSFVDMIGYSIFKNEYKKKKSLYFK